MNVDKPSTIVFASVIPKPLHSTPWQGTRLMSLESTGNQLDALREVRRMFADSGEMPIRNLAMQNTDLKLRASNQLLNLLKKPASLVLDESPHLDRCSRTHLYQWCSMHSFSGKHDNLRCLHYPIPKGIFGWARFPTYMLICWMPSAFAFTSQYSYVQHLFKLWVNQIGLDAVQQ